MINAARKTLADIAAGAKAGKTTMTPVTLIITDDLAIAKAFLDGRPMGIAWDEDVKEVIVPARVIRFAKGEVDDITFDLPDDLESLIDDEVEQQLAAAIEEAREAAS